MIVKTVAVRINVTGADEADRQLKRVGDSVDALTAKLALLRLALKDPLGGLGGLGGVQDQRRGAGGGGGGNWFSNSLKGIAGIGPPAIPVFMALTAAVVGLVVVLGGAISALAAAGMGFAAFGALALPTITKVTAGVSAIGAATTKVARDKAWDAIPKGLQPVVSSVLGLQNAFGKASTALQPLVAQIAAVGLQVANKLLPILLPLAQTAGQAILSLLKGFSQFASSPGFKQFIAQMQQMAGPAIKVIGEGVGKIVVALGKLLQQMANPQGVQTLAIVFEIIAVAIRGIGAAFEFLNKWTPVGARWMLTVATIFLNGFSLITHVALNSIGYMLDGFKLLFGWVPGGVGSSLRKAAASFGEFKASVFSNLSSMRGSLDRWGAALKAMPQAYALRVNITDLQNKLTIARGLLNDPNLTKDRRVLIKADISQLLSQIAAAKFALNALYSNSPTLPIGGNRYLKRAAGGPASGLTLVGEQGPEMVSLPQGSYVWNSTQTRQAMAGGGGGNTYHITVNVPVSANPVEVARQIANVLNQGAKGGITLKKSVVSSH